MHFWWPDWKPLEYSLIDDIKCYTASHSSLASDVISYDASSNAKTGLASDLEVSFFCGWAPKRLSTTSRLSNPGLTKFSALVGPKCKMRSPYRFAPDLVGGDNQSGATCVKTTLQRLIGRRCNIRHVFATSIAIARQALSRNKAHIVQNQLRSSSIR